MAITRRIILALGRNPNEMIRESRSDPGHIREYTRCELEDIGTQVGLLVSSVHLVNYVINDNPIVTAINRLSNFVPSFRDGITIVYEKARNPINGKQ